MAEKRHVNKRAVLLFAGGRRVNRKVFQGTPRVSESIFRSSVATTIASKLRASFRKKYIEAPGTPTIRCMLQGDKCQVCYVEEEGVEDECRPWQTPFAS